MRLWLSIFRWATPLLIFCAVYEHATWSLLSPLSDEQPVLLFASQCDDDLRKIYLNAIHKAEHSILLIIYTLSDPKIIGALNASAAHGVDVTIVSHQSPSMQNRAKELHPKISLKEKKISGLMHQKILVIDQNEVWIGSANMTTDSLVFHDNLVIGLQSVECAQGVACPDGALHAFCVGGQELEFWSLPEEKKEALSRLIELMDKAESSIRIAMFAWTHPQLIEAASRAYLRGVKVEVVLDYKTSIGTSIKTVNMLRERNIPLSIQASGSTFHHKFAWIDGTLLINGSTNWTQAAFSKNADCFLIIHELNENQRKKMETLWKRIQCTSTVCIKNPVAAAILMSQLHASFFLNAKRQENCFRLATDYSCTFTFGELLPS